MGYSLYNLPRFIGTFRCKGGGDNGLRCSTHYTDISERLGLGHTGTMTPTGRGLYVSRGP